MFTTDYLGALMPFLSLLAKLTTIVAALLIVIDPLGVMPIIIGLNASAGARVTRRIILRVIGGSIILLLFFTVTGTWVLRLFQMHISDMQIGGGLLLLIIALKLVTEGRFGPDGEEHHSSATIPLISPMIVGPGAITATVVLAAQHGVWMTSAAVLLALLICLIIFLSARLIHRIIGDGAANLLSRLMGVFVAAIAIAYIRAGVLAFIKLASSG